MGNSSPSVAPVDATNDESYHGKGFSRQPLKVQIMKEKSFSGVDNNSCGHSCPSRTQAHDAYNTSPDHTPKSCWILPFFSSKDSPIVPDLNDANNSQPSTPLQKDARKGSQASLTPLTITEDHSDYSDSSDDDLPEAISQPLHFNLEVRSDCSTPSHGMTKIDYGSMHESNGRLQDALTCYEQELEDVTDNLSRALLLYRIGVVQWKQGSYDSSLLTLRQSSRTYLSSQYLNEDLAQVYWAVGRVYASRGDRRLAKRFLQRALGLIMVDRSSYEDEDCKVQISERTQGLYAQILLAYGGIVTKPSLSLKLFDDALAVQKEVLGDCHVEVGCTLLSFGKAYEKLSDWESANICFWEAFHVFRSCGATSAVDMGVALANIGWIYYQQGNYDAALHANTDALDFVSTLGNKHRNIASIRIQIGMVRFQKSQFDLALEQYRQALSTQRTILGDNHEDVAITLGLIGTVLSCQGRNEKAIEFVDRALFIRQDILGPAHLHVASTLVQLAGLYQAIDKLPAAKQCWLEALDLYHANQLEDTSPCILQAQAAISSLTTRIE